MPAGDDDQRVRITAHVGATGISNATLDHCQEQASTRCYQGSEHGKVKATGLLDRVGCDLIEYMFARIDRDSGALLRVDPYRIQFEIRPVRRAVGQNLEEILKAII